MKRKTKLTLHRETLTRLDRTRITKAAGGAGTYFVCTPACTDTCTESCQTICWGCEPLSDKPTDCECR